MNGEFVFASEFAALLQHPDISRDVDFEAIHHYLSFMCVPAPLTAYRSIRKLEPAHTLRWRKGEIKVERYWQPDFWNKTRISEEEAGEQTIEILRDAVRVRLMSEVPLGAFLSIPASSRPMAFGTTRSRRYRCTPGAGCGCPLGLRRSTGLTRVRCHASVTMDDVLDILLSQRLITETQVDESRAFMREA